MTEYGNSLLPGEVHVWAVAEPQAEDQEALRNCLALLSGEEGDRYRQMPASGRALYACAHAALRAVTASYLGVRPAEVAFRKGPFGKPYVADDPNLHVSLSHAQGLCLVAVGRDGLTGVDVELVRELQRPGSVRRQVLSDWELARCPGARAHPEDSPLAACPPDLADPQGPAMQRLFTHWVCKEAVLKATGKGLAGDLRSVSVDVDAWVAGWAGASGPVAVHGLPPDADGSPWSLHLLDVGPRHRAAVAVAGGGVTVRRFRLGAGAVPVPVAVRDTGGGAAAGRGAEGATAVQRAYGSRG